MRIVPMPSSCYAIFLPQSFQQLLTAYCIKGVLPCLVFKAYKFSKSFFHYHSLYIQCPQPNCTLNNAMVSLPPFAHTISIATNAIPLIWVAQSKPIQNVSFSFQSFFFSPIVTSVLTPHSVVLLFFHILLFR